MTVQIYNALSEYTLFVSTTLEPFPPKSLHFLLYNCVERKYALSPKEVSKNVYIIKTHASSTFGWSILLTKPIDGDL